ncbi:MAG TPA: TauD/TfdA family dioxygenase [Gammaproteobacteria bacterium]|nr:TauD/TfdA family dioxygenase [Gammaproteobacteria bacterium]
MSPSEPDFQPFSLCGTRDYARWRAWKLAAYPDSAAALTVSLEDPAALSAAEFAAISERCRKANMAIYDCGEHPFGKPVLRRFGRRFGLERLDMNLRADEDSITSLRVMPEADGTHYIPYTSRSLNWHTDGYYNASDQQVHGIVMHCVQDAASGGENRLLDPEIAYLLLRDADPAYIRALMQPDAMTIPANIEAGKQIRAMRSGPVFAVEKRGGSLHMRYTARTRSIIWKDDRETRMAVGFLTELLSSDSPWTISHRLRAGQGIICNNVLHSRTAFTDDADSGRVRLLYRARYHDRIRGTAPGNYYEEVQACCG